MMQAGEQLWYAFHSNKGFTFLGVDRQHATTFADASSFLFFFTEVVNANIVHAISEARGGLPPLLSPLSGSGNVSGPVRDY